MDSGPITLRTCDHGNKLLSVQGCSESVIIDPGDVNLYSEEDLDQSVLLGWPC